MSLLSYPRTASIFKRVLTSDVKWALYDTPILSKDCQSPQDSVPHCAKSPMHPRKIILCVWWTSCQVVHYQLLPMGQTTISDLHSQQFERVQQASQQKELVNCKGVLFLHDNA
ncbi:histone-lysine N-methyltransferase SETMAR [Nephila pilipes]|uniref:Histone-lysine N-methyltransferase SETMAR n=1 Tax=Nephila pilipes TaxID=299642 RepID=A0A8X6QDH2_NEPPI|nr:histone-lysine N-methyltransferase SETMAR [Nephila pilipes]